MEIFAYNDNNYYVNFSNDLLKVIKTLSGQTLSSELITPVGSLIMGPIPEANCPDGYLICNGQDVSRTKYAELFSLLGTNFGVGDGSTTFNIPDYRGCFLRMLSTDSTQNTTLYTRQSPGLPNITGTFWSLPARNGNAGASGAFKATSNGSYSADTQVDSRVIELDASRSSSIYGAASEVRPINFAVNYFIKY